MLIASDHAAPEGAIFDAQGRAFRNLRVSLTAACNYACTYCVPDGKQLHRARHELDLAGFLRLVDWLIAEAGIERLRITGGEPLLSPLFDDFLREIVKRPLQEVSLTTNGQLLQTKLPQLLEAGIRRINVSLDTLDAAAFQQICRGGELATVIDGIEAARAAGLAVRINAVPMRGANDTQLLPLLAFALERGAELRFIELMRMGHWHDNADFSSVFMGRDELLALMAMRYPLRSAASAVDATAERFEIPGQGFFGIIANESAPFCASCSRLRLSSAGFLHGCLSNNRRHPLSPLLVLPDELARARLRAILWQTLGDKQPVAFAGGDTVMRAIGG